MSKRELIRQGDVLLVPIDTLPVDKATLKIVSKGECVLAYGEVTGHAHRVLPNRANTVLFEYPGGRILSVESEEDFAQDEKAALVHEEHGTHMLDGLYEVKNQRETKVGVVRRVAD